MTVGIGILPLKERGAVLLCDGMNVGTLRGEQRIWQGSDKLLTLLDPAAAIVLSGNVNDDELHRLGLAKGSGVATIALTRGAGLNDPAESVRTRMAHLFDELCAIDADVRAGQDDDRYGELDEPGPCVLFLLPRRGEGPLLGRFSPVSQRWAARGDMVVVGCVQLRPDLLGETRQPAPDTLAECKAWAVDWAWRFMDRAFGTRDAMAMVRDTGQMPCIGPPFYVLTITEDSFDLGEIKC